MSWFGRQIIGEIVDVMSCYMQNAERAYTLPISETSLVIDIEYDREGTVQMGLPYRLFAHTDGSLLAQHG